MDNNHELEKRIHKSLTVLDDTFEVKTPDLNYFRGLVNEVGAAAQKRRKKESVLFFLIILTLLCFEFLTYHWFFEGFVAAQVLVVVMFPMYLILHLRRMNRKNRQVNGC